METSGRIVAAFIMLEGVAFLAVVIAAITSIFVAPNGASGRPNRPGRARAKARRRSTAASTISKPAWTELRRTLARPAHRPAAPAQSVSGASPSGSRGSDRYVLDGDGGGVAPLQDRA